MCQTGMHAEEKVHISYKRRWLQAEQTEDPKDNCEPKGADHNALPTQEIISKPHSQTTSKDRHE